MKKILCLIGFILVNQYIYSQRMNTITTACPFLLINPNAQSMGLGDIGVVAAADYYESGLKQNPALLSRNEKVMGAKFSYKPWVRRYVAKMQMLDAGCYYAINKKVTLGYSYNLLSLGERSYLHTNGTIEFYKVQEFYHHLNYAQSLTPNLSIGAGLKYIVSDLSQNLYYHGKPMRPGKALAADVGIDYRKEIAKKETSFWRYDFGASLLNMGNKLTYTNTTFDFLPMQLALGTLWTYNKEVSANTRYCLDIAYQADKLLVPTSPIYDIDTNGNKTIVDGKDPNVSVLKGAIQSFYDAPDGSKEEFAELIHKIGIENRFVFNQESSVAIRTGFFHENKLKGNRNYLNAGIGCKYKFIYMDFAMILLYKEDNKYRSIEYASGIKYPYTFNVNIGFKYTFKDKESEKS